MLSASQSGNISRQKPKSINFLEWLSTQPSNKYMSLFSGTRQAAEKEALICQTVRASVKNYYEDGQISSKVKLSPDNCSLVQNSQAFSWLVEEGYLVVIEDRCALTDLAIAKLYDHFAKELQTLPPAIAPGLT